MDEHVELVRRGRPRLRMIALLVLLLVILLLVIAWTQREGIATGFIDRELARRGVQADYEISRLGPWVQRLDNVVIGDPADPDLTARWVQVELSHGFRAPRVRKVTARGVRMAGRIVDGRLDLGQIDRLLPPPSGAPFSLPDLVVDVADTAMRLRTPAGNLGLAIEGKGNLASGFDGRLAAASGRLMLAGCAIAEPRASVDLSTSARRPTVDGPVDARFVSCGGDLQLLGPRVEVETTLAPELDSWIGSASVAAEAARSGENLLGKLAGRLSFAGDARRTSGSVRMGAGQARLAGFTGAGLAIDGGYALAPRGGGYAFSGRAASHDVSAGAEVLRGLYDAIDGFSGTPLEPIGESLAQATVRAARAFDFDGRLSVEGGPDGGALRIASLGARSRSGARFALGGGEGLAWGWPQGALRIGTGIELEGGGFPATRASLVQAPAGLSGTARIAPIAAGDARLALGTITFRPGPRGSTLVRSAAVIDGPLGGGWVQGLSVPIAGRIGPRGFAFGESCTRASIRSFKLADLRLGPTLLPLCPTGPALLWQGTDGAVRGGAELRGLRLAGQLGSSPLVFAPARLRFDLADSSFVGSDVAIRLGGEDYLNRLDLDTLSGRFVTGGVAGSFTGGAGKIANVPLLLSQARGDWQFVGSEAAVDAALTVSDEADPSRFHPLVSEDFRLTIRGNRIDAAGWLNDPETGTRVTRATIVHALDTGSGRASLDVPGIAFGPDFQPDRLTTLTTGVVALVEGTLHGSGEIEWSPAGTRSTGAFSTQGMNLAAPFGPVTGLSGTIRFSDLLGLETAPGQLAEIERVQAGIDVFDGRVRYQLLPGLRVRVESGIWPFAGGELILEETVLDFSQPSAKHLTFRVAGMDAAAFVQQMEFGNIAATGTFDGIVPMIFDERGGRIESGHLAARPPGGVVSYIGELTDKELGAYGKLAFDALKALRYDKLTVDLDGSLDGEFVAAVELDGIARDAPDPGGIAGIAIRQLAKIPFEFNITARGRFRALIAMMRSFDDPSLLIQSALAEQLAGRGIATDVQVEESEDVQ